MEGGSLGSCSRLWDARRWGWLLGSPGLAQVSSGRSGGGGPAEHPQPQGSYLLPPFATLALPGLHQLQLRVVPTSQSLGGSWKTVLETELHFNTANDGATLLLPSPSVF